MKPLGIAVIMGEDLEETLGWAKDSGFHNCQLQLWDMSHLCREHAGYVKDLLEKLDTRDLRNFITKYVPEVRGIYRKSRYIWL